MLYTIISLGLGFMLLERLRPDQELPHVPGWWARVVIVNLAQLGVVILGGYTWDQWLRGGSLMSLSASLPAPAAAFVAYLVITFVFYWWRQRCHQ